MTEDEMRVALFRMEIIKIEADRVYVRWDQQGRTNTDVECMAEGDTLDISIPVTVAKNEDRT